MAAKRITPRDFETSPVQRKQIRTEGLDEPASIVLSPSLPMISFSNTSFTSVGLQVPIDQPVSVQLTSSSISSSARRSHVPLASESVDVGHSSSSHFLHSHLTVSSTNTSSLAAISTAGSSSINRQPVCFVEAKSKVPSGTKGLRYKVLKNHKNKIASLNVNYEILLKEKFLLENGGNFMDFVTWKRKPNVLRDQYLRQQDLELGAVCLPSSSNTTIIQIPLSTVSPTLHATPPKGPTHLSPTSSIVFSTSPRPATRAHASFSSVYENSHEDIVRRARHEAEVMKAISELRKEGLWCASRLPKVHEPARIKTHWDYLLEEMQWLAADFANEKRWKINAARKVRTYVWPGYICKWCA